MFKNLSDDEKKFVWFWMFVFSSGIAFWVIGLANTLLMFKLWGYPFDHERLVSSAPRSAVRCGEP